MAILYLGRAEVSPRPGINARATPQTKSRLKPALWLDLSSEPASAGFLLLRSPGIDARADRTARFTDLRDQLPVKLAIMSTDFQQPDIPKEISPTIIEDLVGCTGYRGPAKSLADMETAIEQGAQSQMPAPPKPPKA